MIDEAHEFPFTEVDDALGHILCQVNDDDLSVLGGQVIVGHQRVVDDPSLLQR